jgi:biotin carboxylase
VRSIILVLSSPGRNRLEHWRHLKSTHGHHRLVCCSVGSCQGWEERFADAVVVVPGGDPATAAAAMLDAVGGRSEISGVVCLSEVYVPIQACLCEWLGLPGPTVTMAEIGRNKHAMRKFLQSCAIPVPSFFLYEGGKLDPVAGMTFPVVAKPVIGSSSTLVRVFQDYDQLAAGLPGLQAAATAAFASDILFSTVATRSAGLPILVEQQIMGDICFDTSLPYRSGEISVESVAIAGKVWTLAIHDAPVPTDGPYFEKVVNSTPTRLPAHLAAEAAAIAQRLHAALGSGAYVLHTEMKTRYDGLQVLEFGIRIGGSSLYRSVKLSTGVDMIDVVVALAQGGLPEVAPRRPATPTIIQYLAPVTEGRITRITGVAALEELPSLVEFRFYDDVGTIVRRPPWKAHASAYAAFQGPDFAILEAEAKLAVATVAFEVERLR